MKALFIALLIAVPISAILYTVSSKWTTDCIIRHNCIIRDEPDLKEHRQGNKFQEITHLLITPGCAIPDLDPFDESIHHLINKLPEMSCPEAGGLTYVDDGVVRINGTIARLFYDDDIEYCEGQQIYRPVAAKNPDFEFKYNKTIFRFNKNLNVDAEFIRISCFDETNKKRYVGFHAFSRDITKSSATSDGANYPEARQNVKRPNVILIQLDSTSRLNSIRHLERTRQFLLDDLEAVELTGYNRVADNSFPNVMPLLTGLHLSELRTKVYTTHLDDIPLIWKRYSRQGYRTLFAEDGIPMYGLFNYLKRGFNNTPTDYYLRPFMLAMQAIHGAGLSERVCVGAVTENKFILNWLYDVLKQPTSRPYFAVVMLWRHIHDGINELSRLDPILHEFLRRLKSDEFFKDTFLSLSSDHGLRFGAFSKTKIGMAERNLPMHLIVLPASLGVAYPSLVKTLRSNAAARMTTPFDVHETLVHISDLNDGRRSGGEEGNHRRRGVSLFEEISPYRTCEDMEIFPIYCECAVQKVRTTSAQKNVVLIAANATVRYMNEKMTIHQGRCAELSLAEVIESEIVVDDTSASKKRVSDRYVLHFKASPGAGEFNAQVRYFNADDEIKVLGDVERLNEYGNESSCIKNAKHQRWCYCLG